MALGLKTIRLYKLHLFRFDDVYILNNVNQRLLGVRKFPISSRGDSFILPEDFYKITGITEP